MKYGLASSVLAFCLFLSSCPEPVTPGKTFVPETTEKSGYTIHDYTLDAERGTLSFKNLNNDDRIVLIPLYTYTRTNTASLHKVFSMDVSYTGSAPTSRTPIYNAPEPDLKSTAASYLSRLPDIAIDPPSYKPTGTRGVTRAPTRAYTPGDTDTFWVIADIGASTTTDVQITATCLYEGTYCHVFFANTLTGLSGIDTLAADIGAAFDSVIYPRNTSLFGYEWGGDPAVPAEAGGIDGDTKVFILLQDTTLGAGGYFSGVDEFDNDDTLSWWNRHSNEKEIFYICYSATDFSYERNPLDTIAHEDQHLITFNQFYRRLGTSQSSIINEGFSQVSENLCGYGPLADMLGLFQTLPRLSYSVWAYSGLGYSNIYAYAAGCTMMDYAVRRFGLSFIDDVYTGSQTGISGINDALLAAGYTEGYAGLVLDAFTAHFVDSDEYAYPANSLYAGDIGIDTDATVTKWYPYPPGKLTVALHGPSTRFYSDFPKSIDVNLYDFGADYYEFVSGDNGTFSFSLSDIADDVVVRAIHYFSTTWPAPHIDGSLGEWSGFTVTEVADAYHDNDRNNSGIPTGTYGQSSADMRKMKGFISSDVLYIAIETEDPPALTDEIDSYLIQIDVTGDSASDYQLNFADEWLFLYALPSGTLLDLDIEGVQYREKDAVEIKIPLSIFPDTLKSTITVKPYFYSKISSSYYYDYPDASIVLTR